ncbi:hypothetical protein BpHYR1_003865 [Brachionus plicatilis]|uniref:Uncharacterized protein n=1 Tax=Brachionus plicatilis TaxID=10195 RepID=A0A3M7PGC2_BRAPC|nr:hypothetical protein BpHYR1_003865 [Brachionus plicatilis]
MYLKYFPSTTNGSPKVVAAAMTHAASPTLRQQAITIILPSLGSMGSLARIFPSEVSSPLQSRASISASATIASATASMGGGSMARDRKSLISPSLSSLMLSASSRRGVRNISGSVKSRPGDQVEAVAGADSASASLALLQVGFGGPDSGVVGHVVVRGEYFLLYLAAVDHVDYVVYGDAGLGNVGAEDDFSFAWRSVIEHSVLVFFGNLGMQRKQDKFVGSKKGAILKILEQG